MRHLEIDVEEIEIYDEARNRYEKIPAQHLVLEHSLLTLSEYESATKDPILREAGKGWSIEKLRTYASFMPIRPVKDPRVFQFMPVRYLEIIRDYINDPHTATTFTEVPGGKKPSNHGTFMTSELIYYWMSAFQLPKDCEQWHLNRLMTLIHIAEEKNKPQKKKSKEQLNSEYAALNAKRRAEQRTHAAKR